MKIRNLPALDNHYWVGMLIASLVGTTLGDFISTDLDLGFIKGLLPLAVALLAVFVAEWKTKAVTEIYYWGAVVLTRTAATNLADLATHGMKLDYAWLEPILFTLLLVISLFPHSKAQVSSPLLKPSKELLVAMPNNDARYWMMMLVVSTIGTTLGDFTSDNLGFGVAKASIILAFVLIGIFYLKSKFGLLNMATGYWVTLIAVRTAGTVMGDFLSGEDGLGLGFMISAGSTTFLLGGLLCLWRPRAGKLDPTILHKLRDNPKQL